MKKQKLISQHMWLGLTVGILLSLFCLSGIVLNHRQFFSPINISRNYLPEIYQYKNWNNGLMRGTLKIKNKNEKIKNKDCNDTSPSIRGTFVEGQNVARERLLIFGKGGIWLSNNNNITDFNQGLPEEADYRNVLNIVKHGNTLFACAQYGVYSIEINGKSWNKITISDDEERLTDIAVHGDSLVVLSRNEAYLLLPPYNKAEKITLKPAIGETPHKTLFRILWTLHSGEMFGIVGRLIVDCIAVIFLWLIYTGIRINFLKLRIKRANSKVHNNNNTNIDKKLSVGGSSPRGSRMLSTSEYVQRVRGLLNWHNKVGRYTIILTILIALTGAFLRPPLMIPVFKVDVKDIIAGSNAWEDKLRMLQYDDACQDWLLSTSDGFYSLKTLHSAPQRIENSAPVSLMGINVMKPHDDGTWTIGSFSGLYEWNRKANAIIDATTGSPIGEDIRPFGNTPVAGYSEDFGVPFIVSYYEGTGRVPQPAWMSGLPMSLWNLALEVHTGRIFTFIGTFGSFLYIFFMAFLSLWLLYTGWKIRIKKKTHRLTENSMQRTE